MFLALAGLAGSAGPPALAQGIPSFDVPCEMPCFIYGVQENTGVNWIDVCDKRWGLFPNSPLGYNSVAARHPDSLYLSGGGRLAIWRIGSTAPEQVVGAVPAGTVALTEDGRNLAYAGTNQHGAPVGALWRVWPDNVFLGTVGANLQYIGDLAYQYAPLYIPPIVGSVFDRSSGGIALVDVSRATGAQRNPRPLAFGLGSLAYDGFDRLWGEDHGGVYAVNRATGAVSWHMSIAPDDPTDFASTPRCGGQGEPMPDADVGDAPDSTNHFAAPMTAYPSIGAAFPSVFDLLTGAPAGHLHWFPDADHWVGASVTKGEDADQPPDADGRTNIEPPPDLANRDGGDNGIAFPIQLPHCRLTSFQYTVTVAGAFADRYLNLWLDFNRNGAWGDEMACTDPETGQPALVAEWAVPNALWRLGPGTHVLTTPPFRSLDVGDSLWLRLTVSDEAASGSQGQGPAGGYEVGETEDYLLHSLGSGCYGP